MAKKGEAFVLAFEKAVPRSWDVKTGEVQNAAAAWARDPYNEWELQMIRNQDAGERLYNVELYEMDGRGQGIGGLVNGATVNSPRKVKSNVRKFAKEATGETRPRKNRKPRTGVVDDNAGLFGDLF